MDSSRPDQKEKTMGATRENKKRNKWFFWDIDRGGPGYGFWIFIIGMLLVFIGGAVALAYIWSKQENEFECEERESTSAVVSYDDIPNGDMKAAAVELAGGEKFDVFVTNDDRWFLRLGFDVYDWDPSQKRWFTQAQKSESTSLA